MQAEEKSALDFPSACALKFLDFVFVEHVHFYVYLLDEWTMSGYVPFIVSLLGFFIDAVIESWFIRADYRVGGHFVGEGIVVHQSGVSVWTDAVCRFYHIDWDWVFGHNCSEGSDP